MTRRQFVLKHVPMILLLIPFISTADEIVVDETQYQNVYIVEGSDSYYLSDPDTGVTQVFPKSSVKNGFNKSIDRKLLLERYNTKKNQQKALAESAQHEAMQRKIREQEAARREAQQQEKAQHEAQKQVRESPGTEANAESSLKNESPMSIPANQQTISPAKNISAEWLIGRTLQFEEGLYTFKKNGKLTVSTHEIEGLKQELSSDPSLNLDEISLPGVYSVRDGKIIISASNGNFVLTWDASSDFLEEFRPDDDAYQGFRGVMWYDNPSEHNALKFNYRKGGVSGYTRSGDKLSIGGADITEIFYYFYKDRFYRVAMSSEGTDNYDALKMALVEKFGHYQKLTERNLYWSNKDHSVVVVLIFDEITEKITCGIEYRIIGNEERADIESHQANQAIDGAESDF